MCLSDFICRCCPCFRSKDDNNKKDGNSDVQPSYGSTVDIISNETDTDNNPRYSAMQYHYQHRISIEKQIQIDEASKNRDPVEKSGQTIYECAGPAMCLTNGEIVVMNPMLNEEAEPH